LFDEFSAIHARRGCHARDMEVRNQQRDGLYTLSNITAQIPCERWGFWVGMYYSAITFLTIGLGDFSPVWYGDTAIFEVISFVACSCFGIVLFLELVGYVNAMMGDTSEDEPDGDEGSASKPAAAVKARSFTLERAASQLSSHNFSKSPSENKMARRMWRQSANQIVTANVFQEGVAAEKSRRSLEEAAGSAVTSGSCDSLGPGSTFTRADLVKKSSLACVVAAAKSQSEPSDETITKESMLAVPLEITEESAAPVPPPPSEDEKDQQASWA